MVLVNIDYIPGKEFEVLGMAKGTVVQSKNFGKDFMAGMKTLVGGEITGYTEMLNEARQIAVKRMVDEGEDGFLFPSRDSAAMADRIRRIIDDPALFAHMRKRAAEIYRERFTGEIFARNVEAVYDKALED